MKKILVSLLLLTTMLIGCGKQENSVIDSNAFNLDNNTASTQQEQSTEVEDDTKATATSLISKFMEDAKKGFSDMTEFDSYGETGVCKQFDIKETYWQEGI